MGLRENLEQGRGIPAGTRPERVRQLRAVMVHELETRLCRQYCWLATAYVAVEAGRWGGDRRQERRLKLAEMVRGLNLFLGDNPERFIPAEKGWERKGLAYGYNTVGEVSEQHALSSERVILLGMMVSGHIHLEGFKQ